MEQIDLISEKDNTKKRKNFSKNNMGSRKPADFYETPYSMTKQLLEVERFEKLSIVKEPACGDLAIVTVLNNAGFKNIHYSDFRNGDDFLIYSGAKIPQIITNPPFSIASEFILKAKQVCDWKFAFLLPLDYLHGHERYMEIYQDTFFPLFRIWVFVRRPMLGQVLRRDGKYETGMQTYAWFVWDKNHRGPPQLGWIDNQKFVLSKQDKLEQ